MLKVKANSKGLEAFGKRIAQTIKEAVRRAVTKTDARVDALEKRITELEARL